MRWITVPLTQTPVHTIKKVVKSHGFVLLADTVVVVSIVVFVVVFVVVLVVTVVVAAVVVVVTLLVVVVVVVILCTNCNAITKIPIITTSGKWVSCFKW